MYNWKVSAICEGARTMVTATVDTCLGTSEASDKNEVKLYPNPFKNTLNISSQKEIESLSIVDLSGKVVKVINNPRAQVNLGELVSGLYFVNLKYKDGGSKTVKVIKE